MINRDEIMDEAVSQFAVGWHDEDDKTDGDNYVTGTRRRAGLHRVFDILERDYIIVRRDDDQSNHRSNN